MIYSDTLRSNIIYFIKNCRFNPLKYILLDYRSITYTKILFDSLKHDSNYTYSLNVNSIPSKFTIENKNQTQYRKNQNYHQKNVANKEHKSFSTLNSDECLIDAEISGLASPLSAMCWHKGPYSNYFNDSSETPNHETDHSIGNSESRNDLFPKVNLVREMEHLLSLERREKDRVRLILEKNKPLRIDEHIRDNQLASKVSTLKLLSISSKIAKRAPSSAKPQLDLAKSLKEKRYQKLLFKDRDGSNEGKRTSRKQITVETVRILDVDRLPLPILHHMLCYTLVKNVPAENVLKIISNIASLRDKNKHVCYQNIFKLVCSKSNPICAPEIVATLTRSYQSISIPFMVDYVRKYGTFSRKFLANLIDRHSRPLALDFLRYQSHSRNLPLILTRPWSLLSFVNLLKNSSAKRYMYLNLLNYGYVPNLQKFDQIHTHGTMDYDLSGEILSFEKMLHEDLLISGTKEDPHRPKIYDKILELQYLGDTNLDDLELNTSTELQEPTSTSVQFIKVLDQQQDSSNDAKNPFQGYQDVEESIPVDGSHISWSVPWGLKRDLFHYRGKTYKLDRVSGWIGVKSNVRINYLKNVKMNKRKRERRLLRRRARKQAKIQILSSL